MYEAEVIYILGNKIPYVQLLHYCTKTTPASKETQIGGGGWLRDITMSEEVVSEVFCGK